MKDKGIRLVKSEVLQDVGEKEFGADPQLRLRLDRYIYIYLYISSDKPDAPPVNSVIIRDQAKADPSKVVYVVKEANVWSKSALSYK